MRTSILALGIVALCLGGFAIADGDDRSDGRNEVYELTKGKRHARFAIWNTKLGTIMLDTATGNSWRMEFQDKSGYVWSQIPRGIMRDPVFTIPNPVTGGE